MTLRVAAADRAWNPALVEQLAKVHPLAWAMHAAGWRKDRRTGSVAPRYHPARHLKFLALHLMRIHRGECKRLLVSMPPRFGKTLLTSRFFNGWWLGTHPADRVIMTTYQATLVRRWSRQIRNDLARHGPAVFGVAASTRAAGEEWDLLAMRERSDDEEPVDGGVSAVGTGGALTGKGANILNCDDLVQGSEAVRNPAIRGHMWEWFEQDLMTRLEPGGACLVTMTRWHSDDIPGRIVKSQEAGHPIGGEPWEVINLPALAEEDDPLGREPGESLCEEFWPRATLERMRNGMSPYAWAALFCGRPVPSAGGIFQSEWLCYFQEDGRGLWSSQPPCQVAPGSLLRYLTVDLAFSKKTSADYTVIATWGLDVPNNRLFLLDLVRRRLHAPEVGPAMREAMGRSGASIAYVEANNLKLDQMDVIRRSGVPMREIQPNTDKVARFMPVTAHAASGRLLLRAGAPWLPDLERELLAFAPGCEHDDQADAVAYGVHVANDLAARAGGPPPVPGTGFGSGPPPMIPGLRRPT